MAILTALAHTNRRRHFELLELDFSLHYIHSFIPNFLNVKPFYALR